MGLSPILRLRLKLLTNYSPYNHRDAPGALSYKGISTQKATHCDSIYMHSVQGNHGWKRVLSKELGLGVDQTGRKELCEIIELLDILIVTVVTHLYTLSKSWSYTLKSEFYCL